MSGPFAPGDAVDLEAVARAYLEAFAGRDLERCVDFYADDATIDFKISTFRGRRGIEAWHRDRFAANLRVERLESLRASAEEVVVDVVAASDRLAAWKIPELSARITLSFDGGRISLARFAPRMMSPIDMIRAG
jgi:hypothetical protein